MKLKDLIVQKEAELAVLKQYALTSPTIKAWPSDLEIMKVLKSGKRLHNLKILRELLNAAINFCGIGLT